MSIKPDKPTAGTSLNISPYLGLGIAILAVSASAILIRMAQTEVSSLVIAAYRLLIAATILAFPALMYKRNEISGLTFTDWGLILLSGLFLAIHFASWITSLEYTSIAASVVIVTSTPLWVALFSPLLLKERIPNPVRWGLGIAMLGAVLVGGAQTFENGQWMMGMKFLNGHGLWGQFLALLGALFVAGYFMIGRKIRKKVSLLTYTFLVYGTAAILLTILVIGLKLPLLGYQPRIYFLLLLMALFPQLIGHSTYNWALKYLPATVIAIAALGEPIGATLLGYWLLKESPHLLEIIGGAIILTGIFMASRGNQVQVG